MKLLLVEDNPDNVEDFKSTLERYIDEHTLKIDVEYACSFEEAMKELNTTFDGAIIDLKLQEDTEGGNKVISEILQQYRVPIAVLTGTPSNLGHDEAPLLQLFVRDDGYDPVLNFLKDIYNTGLTQILGGRGVFEKSLNQLFWTNIPEAIPHFLDSDDDAEKKQTQLLRFTIAHMSEHLEHNMETLSSSAETYIYPPIRTTITEGGIVKEKSSDNLYVVLTPACDLANNKAELVQIVVISKLLELPDIKIFESAEKPLSKSKKSQLENKLKKYVRNQSSRYHYLPKFGLIQDESVVDFQQIRSEPFETFLDEFEIQGNVSVTFYKDLVDRFSSNYSRQGSPDYDFESKESELIGLFS